MKKRTNLFPEAFDDTWIVEMRQAAIARVISRNLRFEMEEKAVLKEKGAVTYETKSES